MYWISAKKVVWSDLLAEELHKPIKRRFPTRRVIVGGVDDTWSADLVDMQSFSKHNDGVKYLLNVIDVFSKYAWSVPLIDKTGKSMTRAFDTIVGKRKPSKLWVDRGGEFYNRAMDRWLEENGIERYSTYNEGKAVVVERFNRTLKTRMWKYMSANTTYRYIDVLDELLRKYNSSYHRSIRMTPIKASDKRNESAVWNHLYGNAVDPIKPKLKVGDRVRISKKKTIFEKGYTPNWTEEVFEITRVQDTTPVTYKIKDWNGVAIDGSFYEPELQKTAQDVFRIEKVIRRRGQRALVKWEGYPNTFNSWVSIDALTDL